MVRLGLGCSRFGGATSSSGWGRSVRLVHGALDHGVSYFDTADAYGAGTSERILGAALAGRRPQAVVATKGGYRFAERSVVGQRVRPVATATAMVRAATRRMGGGGEGGGNPAAYSTQDFSPAYLTRALDASLRRLGTDHVDVYQLHGPRQVDHDAVVHWATATVASGRIGRFGIGAEDLEQVRPWLADDIVSSVQLPVGLLDPAALDDVIPAARAAGCAVVARGVLGAGLLGEPATAGSANAHKLPLIHALRAVADEAGVSVGSLAVGYVRARADVDTILVGTRSIEHLTELVAAVAGPPLDASLLAIVEETLAAHRWDQREG